MTYLIRNVTLIMSSLRAPLKPARTYKPSILAPTKTPVATQTSIKKATPAKKEETKEIKSRV